MLRFLQRDKDVRHERLLVALRAYVSDHLYTLVHIGAGWIDGCFSAASSFILLESAEMGTGQDINEM